MRSDPNMLRQNIVNLLAGTGHTDLFKRGEKVVIHNNIFREYNGVKGTILFEATGRAGDSAFMVKFDTPISINGREIKNDLIPISYISRQKEELA